MLRALPPDRLLRVLFWLDQQIYYLESHLAIAYGGGVHTKHRHTGYHKFFIERIRAGDRVLDIGCGTGALAHDMAERAGATVVAIDKDRGNIAQANRRFSHARVAYCVGDVQRAFLTGSFEVAVLSNVLEHLPERPEFLRLLMCMARPARILIRVPLFERDWRVPLRRELGVEWRLDPTHETEYTLESFADEMTRARMAIAHQEVRWGEIWAEVVPVEPAERHSCPPRDEGRPPL